MTQNEHTLIAAVILQFILHVFLKQHFVTKKDKKEWSKIIGRFF